MRGCLRGDIGVLWSRPRHGRPEMYKNAMQVGQKAQVATLGL